MPRHEAHRALSRSLEDLARAQREAYTQIAREVGCPRAGLGILRILDRTGARTIGDLAVLGRVDISVTSRQVSTLSDAGLVEREVTDEDRRARTVRLTAAGRDLVTRADAALDGLVDDIFAAWSVEELSAAAAQISRVGAAVAAYDRPRTTSRM